jgi:Short C-terminal domain/Phospholipase_D-nuclease N-terminal
MLAELGLGELLWSLLVIYLMVMYLVIVFTVIFDIFRSDDLSGVKKAIWVIALLMFPFVTLVVYLITRGDGLGQRNLAAAQPPAPTADDYVRSAAVTGGGIATEIEKAKGLLDSGAITADEFAAIKSRLLSS